MKKITIRNCEVTDKNWVSEVLKEGTKNGHFSLHVNQIAPLLDQIINGKEVIYQILRDGQIYYDKYGLIMLIATINGSPASFLILKSGIDGVELHLAGTLKTHRHKGCFNALANYVIQNNTENSRLYARCYKKSTFAIRALEKLGFEKTKDGDPIELEFKQLVQHEDPIELELNQKVPTSLVQNILKFLRIK